MSNPINTGAFSSNNIEAVASDLVDGALGGLSPLNNFGKYFTGSRAIIKLNDKLFGFAMSCSFTINTEQDEIWTIDDWTPFELAPKTISVSGTLGMFHIPGKGPSRELIQSNVLSFLFHKYITIEIRDQMTDQTIFRTEKAVVTSRSQNIDAGSISTIQLNWKAIGWSDELKPFYPRGYDAKENGNQAGGGLVDAAKGAVDDAIDSIKSLF